MLVTPQVVQGTPLSREVASIMLQALFNTGLILYYSKGEMGSAWYVEVPAFLNNLYSECGEDATRDALYKLINTVNDDSYLWDMVMGAPYQL